MYENSNLNIKLIDKKFEVDGNEEKEKEKVFPNADLKVKTKGKAVVVSDGGLSSDYFAKQKTNFKKRRNFEKAKDMDELEIEEREEPEERKKVRHYLSKLTTEK